MIRTVGIGDDGLIVAVFKLHERCRVVVYVYRVYTEERTKFDYEEGKKQ